MSYLLSFILLAALTRAGIAQQPLRAIFHMAGVNGTAHFSLSQTTLTINIVLSKGLGSSTSVQIRPFWMNYDVSDKCSELQLGTIKFSTTVDFAASTAVASFQNITSLDIIEGNTIVLNGTNTPVCASIEKEGDYLTAVAYFQGAVFGSVYFRQHSSSNSQTQILSDLFTAEELHSGMWKISNDFANCSSMSGTTNINVYNPLNVNGSGCSASSPESCAVGNLSGKLGGVFIGACRGEKRFNYSDKNLPLMGNNNIDQKLLLIYSSNNISLPFCAMIRVYTRRTAKVNFSHDGVTGSFTFTQNSPFDPTTTEIKLDGLQDIAKGYHVHKWPTPLKAKEGQSLCSDTIVSGHLNPYNINTTFNYPSPDRSTDDMYELGDLSSKYGTLENKSNWSTSFLDHNLPLFGSNSIVGRSLVIHKNDVIGSRWICSNIESQSPMVAAVAVFKYPVIGHIIFLQEKNQPLSETSVSIQLDYNDGRPPTENHEWMINTDPINNDMLLEDVMKRCKSTGETYNPLKLSQQVPNKPDCQYCKNYDPFPCFIGDLYGKLGPLSIRNSGAEDTLKRTFFTGMNLPLSGPNSIIGKPIVIMAVGNTNILSCTNVQPLHDTMLAANFDMGQIKGMVSFKQLAGFGATQTIVKNELTGLTNYRLRVHELPPVNGTNACSDVGPIFNPFNISQDPTSTTDDKYKVGDLTRYSQSGWNSHNLPLSGVSSVLGRSLVIVGSDNNETVACAKIETFLPDMNNQYITAMSTFTGAINGTVTLSQTLYADGTMSDTTILLNLGHSNGVKTLDHNWHTHKAPVYHDAQASEGRCNSTGPHFDPYMTMKNESNYKTECTPLNPLRCELGDQSSKLAPYDVGGGRKLFTDIDLPLSGKFSVQGRSIVLHVEGRGLARQACADIIPVTTDSIVVEFRSPNVLNITDVALKYATAIQANPEDIVVQLISEADGKTKVHVHFLGLQRASLLDRFQIALKKEDTRKNLDPYAPVVSAGNLQIFSTVLLLLILGVHLTLNV